MTVARMIRAAIVLNVFVIAALTSSIRADEPKTQPTTDPTNAALAAFEGKDTAFAAAVDRAYAVIVFPKVAGSDEDSGQGHLLKAGKVVGTVMVESSGVGITRGTAYAEVVLVEDKKTLDSILDSGLRLDEKVSVTTLTDGRENSCDIQGRDRGLR